MIKRYLKRRIILFSIILFGILLISLLKISITDNCGKSPLLWRIIDYKYYSDESMILKNIIDNNMAFISSFSNYSKNIKSNISILSKKNKAISEKDNIFQNKLSLLKDEQIRLISAIKEALKGSKNPDFKVLSDKIDNLRDQLANKLVYYGKNHPEIIAIGVKIRLLKKRLDIIPSILPANNKQVLALKKLIDQNSKKIESLSYDLMINSIKKNKNKALISMYSKNSAFLYNKVQHLNIKYRIKKKIEFHNAVLSLIIFVMSSLFLLIFLERYDPFYFHSMSFMTDSNNDVIFLFNKDIMDGNSLVNSLSLNSKRVLIADLYPKAGMFCEFSENGINSLEDHLIAPGTLDLSTIKKNENLYYWSIRLGTDPQAIIDDPIFHKTLLCFKSYFDYIIVHLPKICPKKNTLRLIKNMGKIKILAKSITHREVIDIDDFAEVLIHL